MILTITDSPSRFPSIANGPIPQKFSYTIDEPAPTLLTIPQELRDDIFKLVYTTTIDKDEPIELHFVSARRAGTESHEAPPTKATLLVCKQLHTEMKKMHAAAVRQYWTTHRFLVNPKRAHPSNLHLDLVANRDIQHVSSLALLTHCSFSGDDVQVPILFGTSSGWTASLPKTRSTHPAPHMELLRRQLFQNTLRVSRVMLRMKRSSDGYEVSAIDPATGRGFTVRELDRLLARMRGLQI
jgi:hypothetical protein